MSKGLGFVCGGEDLRAEVWKEAVCGLVEEGAGVFVLLSLEVTQWRTRTEKRTATLQLGICFVIWEGSRGDVLSALQHMRQIQEASPWRVMRTVRLLSGRQSHIFWS